MARSKGAYPDLKFHSPSGQWCIYLNNRRVTLGTDRESAEHRRLALISGQPQAMPAPGTLTLAEALDLYRRHLVRQQCDRRKLARLDAAVRVLASQGHTLASGFRGPALKEVRARLCAQRHRGQPLTRRYINHLIDAIVLAFRWLVTEDHVPADNLARLREASAELAESIGGRESLRTAAVCDAVVVATLAHCSPILAAMIQIQRATGMRPGELCRMSRAELSTRPDESVPIAGMSKRIAAVAFQGELIWLYAPAKHKNLHRSKPRVIAIGREAQALLLPLLADGLLFRTERGCAYTPATYGNAVARACRRAGVERWSPNQLRKAAAERVDNALNPDAAAAMLGHSASRQALDAYIQTQIQKAVEAAARAG